MSSLVYHKNVAHPHPGGVELLVGSPNGEHFSKTRTTSPNTFTFCGLVRTGLSGSYTKQAGSYPWRVFVHLKIHHAQGHKLTYRAVSQKRWITVVS